MELIHNAAIHAFGQTVAGEISIRAHLMKTEDDPCDTKIVLLIEDNGCGMHESIETTAFDPFTAKDSVNLGFGLHVVVT